MKHLSTILVLLLLAAVGVLWWYIDVYSYDDPERVIAREELRIDYRTNIVAEIIYIQDKDTGICFAYYWGGSGNGGPALATVDCEKIR